MSPEEMAKVAQQLFEEGFHCSQALFSAGMEKLGVNDVEDCIATLSPFGGGIASTGNTCGTILGAIAVIGFLQGKKRPKERDGKAMWRLSYKLFKAFEDITRDYGGSRCSDIARVNWHDPKEVKEFRRSPNSRRKECFRVIRETALVLGKMLEEIDEGKV